MTRREVLQEVQAIVRAELDDPSLAIADATRVDDLPDWDSVAHVRIIVAVESRFGILLDPEEYTEFEDMGAMIDCICDKLARKTDATAAGARAMPDK